jgi:hypothetical protein
LASQAAPRPARLDQLGLVQADRRLHERVVQSVADGTDRGVGTGLDEVGGEPERRILTGIGMMDQSIVDGQPSRSRRHNAMSNAPSTNGVRLFVAAHQPTIARENTSTTIRND